MDINYDFIKKDQFQNYLLSYLENKTLDKSGQNLFNQLGLLFSSDTGDNFWDLTYDNEIYVPEIELMSKSYIKLATRHYTMNSELGRAIYMRMQNQLLYENSCICYLVDLNDISRKNEPWRITIDGKRICHERIRKLGLDFFYSAIFKNSI